MVWIDESILVFGTFGNAFLLMVGHKDRTLGTLWTDDITPHILSIGNLVPIQNPKDILPRVFGITLKPIDEIICRIVIQKLLYGTLGQVNEVG